MKTTFSFLLILVCVAFIAPQAQAGWLDVDIKVVPAVGYSYYKVPIYEYRSMPTYTEYGEYVGHRRVKVIVGYRYQTTYNHSHHNYCRDYISFGWSSRDRHHGSYHDRYKKPDRHDSHRSHSKSHRDSKDRKRH